MVEKQAVSTNIAVVTSTSTSIDVADRIAPYVRHARELIEQTLSRATRRAYKADWGQFRAWCASLGADPAAATPEVLVTYFSYLHTEKLTPPSISRAYNGITHYLRKQGEEAKARWPLGRRRPEIIDEFFRGMRLVTKHKPAKKQPLMTSDVVRLCDLPLAALGGAGGELEGARNRALLLLGYTGYFRRSELAALNREDLRVVERGMTVQVRQSKTDQEGEGAEVAIPKNADSALCAVAAVSRWLKAARVAGTPIETGPVFRRVEGGKVLDKRIDDREVARVVKLAVEALGLNPKRFAGHSLRSGGASSADAAGKGLAAIMRQGRWKSERTALGYIRPPDAFANNAADGVLKRR